MTDASGVEITPLYIGGEARQGQSQFLCVNALSGEAVTRAAAATLQDVADAAMAAQQAQAGWAASGPNARRSLLIAAADELASRSEDIVAAMMEETGATEAWSRFNIALGASMLREAACLTTQIQGEVIPSDRPGLLAMAIREPAGVVLGIAPWNAPVILGVRAIATPLACGNCVILKSSEQCPRTHALIVESLIAAGFPSGVVSLISNKPEDAAEVVAALIDHKAVRRVNFTGSTSVGRIVAVRAAQNLKPALLELGGKAPMIVLDDADLDEAVAAASFGAYMNQGQICMSTERLIVLDSIAEKFLEKLTAKVKKMPAGDPREGKTPLGAVVDAEAVARVQGLVHDALAKGAKLLAGGAADGVLMSATLLDGVTPDMRIYREESFGPVLSVIRVANEDEAIQTANDSEYGLSASVFGRDAARALRVARRVQSGICHINGSTVADEAQMPFGGCKDSGYGRFGGKAGIDAFTELRWITMATESGHYPI